MDIEDLDVSNTSMSQHFGKSQNCIYLDFKVKNCIVEMRYEFVDHPHGQH